MSDVKGNSIAFSISGKQNTGSSELESTDSSPYSNPVREPNDEVIPLRHLHLRQRPRVDHVILADELVERENIDGQCIDVASMTPRPSSARRSINPLPATGESESSCWRCLEMLTRTSPSWCEGVLRARHEILGMHRIVLLRWRGCPAWRHAVACEKIEPADRSAGSCDTRCRSDPLRIRNGELARVRHLHLRQRLGIHHVVLANDLVE